MLNHLLPATYAIAILATSSSMMPVRGDEPEGPLPPVTAPIRTVVFVPELTGPADAAAQEGTAPQLVGPAEAEPMPREEAADGQTDAQADGKTEEKAEEAVQNTTENEAKEELEAPTNAPAAPAKLPESAATAEASDTPKTTDTEAQEEPAQPEVVAEPRRLPLPELSPEMVALRDRLRKVLAVNQSRPFSTSSNTAGQILPFCRAYGVETTIQHGSTSSRSRQATKVSGLGALCSNVPCSGYRLLRASDHGVVARVGYGYQSAPGEFLAVLAWSRVAPDFGLNAGDTTSTVADLAAAEKYSCRSGADLSLKLAGLAYYAEPGETWTNATGETWSLDRMVAEELERTVDRGSAAIVNHLLGLSSAIVEGQAHGNRKSDEILAAEKYVVAFQEFALGVRNSDGSWHPRFFAVRGTSTDYAASLYANGLILQWLAYSLPEESLGDPRVAQSISYLTSLLGKLSTRKSLSTMTTQERDGMSHAIRALSIYDGRYFQLWDGVESPAAETAGLVGPATR